MCACVLACVYVCVCECSGWAGLQESVWGEGGGVEVGGDDVEFRGV